MMNCFLDENRLCLKRLAVILSLFSFSALGQFSPDWKLSDKGASFVEKDNREVLYLTKGSAINENSSFGNGTIEFEVKMSGERAFIYVYFRQQSNKESEVLYFRSHKSNAPDTLQYSPVYQGRSAWQIYHNERGTASAFLPENQWVKVKLEIQGQTMSVWVGEQSAPVMENVALTGTKAAGAITLRGFIPGASKANYSAYFRNVVIKSTSNANDGPEQQSTTDKNVLNSFAFSSAFASEKIPVFTLPNKIVKAKWQHYLPDNHGVYEFLRYITIPDGVKQWAVAADILLISPEEQSCSINLGFSDTLSLQLNGKPLVYADASYRYAQNRQEGLLHDRQLSVYLPLKQGENRLRAVIGDSFGGWGFLAKLSGCENIKQTKVKEPF